MVSLPLESMRYRMITEEGGTEEHFQIGSVAITHQRIFDWLVVLLLYIYV